MTDDFVFRRDAGGNLDIALHEQSHGDKTGASL